MATATTARQLSGATLPASGARAIAPRPAVSRPACHAAAASLRRPAAPAARPERRSAALAVTANAAVAIEARPTTSVTFKTVRKLQFGQVLKIVGTGKELGSWDCARAPAMKWGEGDKWTLTMELPTGKHEFKVAVAQGDSLVHYEDGPNRTLQVPEATPGEKHRAFTVNCEWGSLASWLETLLPEDELPSPSGSTSMGSISSWNSNSSSAPRKDWTLPHSGSPQPATWQGGSSGHSADALQAEVNELRRQLAARNEEAAAFSRACDQLRAERDHIAHQLSLAQQQLATANEEKAVLAAAAAKSERNIQLLRQVGQLLNSMHD
ncbi:hypothetical protein COHA_004893 [Chlorella ohadii]|uniref:CBM20 domain-containing protein n=1 Tax=Chlorella ohadii TaxID=2649997 RepID=A0AAD5DT02_9CHLO|nr:hypothetical protein COHA_004893 [Chlorella ohadii]